MSLLCSECECLMSFGKRMQHDWRVRARHRPLDR